MKILLLADYYPAYLKAFHAANAVGDMGYVAAQECLLSDYFGSFVSYRNHFRRIGHDCELVIGNDYVLQSQWLREAGLPERVGPESKLGVVLQQVKAFAPDVIFMGSMFDYFGDFAREAARVTPNLFVWIACPYPRDLDFSGIRGVFSSVDAFVAEFRAAGLRAERLDAAFDPDILAALGPTEKCYDVTFIGGLSSRSHRHRVRALKSLVRQGIRVDLWGYGLDRGLFPNPLARSFHGEVWGLDYYRTLAQSRITLNFHIDVARSAGFAGNMRTFEATGCGCALATDGGEEVERLFRRGEEVFALENISDLASSIRALLADREACAALSARGQARCIREHGYAVRIREFERALARHLD
ncbi:MAG: glycosyltransferase [Burkholderiales bacterium]